MKIIFLQRTEPTPQGTFGVLIVGRVQFFTGELPWNCNEENVSCVPTGTYRCDWKFSEKFKRETYLLSDVPGRDDIRIHPANLFGVGKFKSEVQGCIGLGRLTGEINGQKALMKSKEAVKHFEQILNGESFMLKIQNWDSASQSSLS